MTITLDQAEILVDSRSDLRWDGWTIVQSKPNNAGWLKAAGEWNPNTRRWHMTTRYTVQTDGNYIIPKALGYGL